MCGIVGYIGKNSAQDILLDGLKMLEYRGYDSAGMAVLNNGRISIEKLPGKIKLLEERLNKKPLKGVVGIGHCRWATHGEPNYINAHPHCDCKNDIIVVHNGIIENFQFLKNRLIQEGHKFKSQTDTEVIPHLIEKYYKGSLIEAVRTALVELKGSYAIAVMSKREPNVLVGARCGSPLIVGLGKNENFLASDVPAILNSTKDVLYLDDYEVASVTATEVKISNIDGRRINKKPTKITWDITQARKNGFPYFMLKEINEQPKVLSGILSKHISRESNRIVFDGSQLDALDFKKIKNFIIIACGTAYHAGLVGKYLIERFTGKNVLVDMSSEFRYRNPILDKDTLVIAISQSGETADTLAGLREAKKKGAKILSICNVVGSSLTRESDAVIYTHAGPEIGVASTKAYTAQIMILNLLSIYIGHTIGFLTNDDIKDFVHDLKRIPDSVNLILKEEESKIAECAKKFYTKACFLYLARNINYPNALEGALKLKEISYIHAEGYPAGEMKHGPIALIDQHIPVVCIATESAVYEKMISSIQEIKARKGIVIALATVGDEVIKRYADYVISIPTCHEINSAILTVIPLQLLAYHIAVKNGRDVDQPRNLAKSVTVE